MTLSQEGRSPKVTPPPPSMKEMKNKWIESRMVRKREANMPFLLLREGNSIKQGKNGVQTHNLLTRLL